jgi:prephenate dehydrogenase
LCKTRINNELYGKIKKYLDGKDLMVIETTPEKHDKDIAKSLFLTHFVGRTLIDFDAKNVDIDTEGYKRLMKILDTVENDTQQLFEDMNKYNKYSKKIRQDFIESVNRVNMRLEK